ncbi:MaoC family dehydratase [Pararhizobium sp.]|uniref:MaoC family dehydratase n=1 Tax=Pararhizobium sp. TaxID=1977563 RepID=UPI0027176FA1|nr:MaoC family dehydratase [Pararhizobium sp.]MDO9414805.1 MaoC family dehydratase [Pararhizobium sp.]
MKMSELYPDQVKTITGSVTFSADDIIAFATKFDPQPFHLDAEAASHSLFGGLCASGWHTCAGWMKCFVPYWISESKRLVTQGIAPPKLGPSPGFKNLRWLKPVFAGDTITYAVTLLSSRELESRPGWILNTIACEGENQHGETVIRFESTVLEFT